MYSCADAVADQSGPPAGAAPSLEPCGKVNTSPCSKPNVRPCECPLEVDPDTGLCTSPISAGALCPQRPYCGYDKGPTCAFPFESPCDECNEVDGAANICVRNPFCTRGMLQVDVERLCIQLCCSCIGAIPVVHFQHK